MSTTPGVLLYGDALRSLRRGARLTQSQLAYRVNCSTVHYRAVESGRVHASEALLDRLADLFNVRPHDLLKPTERNV